MFDQLQMVVAYAEFGRSPRGPARDERGASDQGTARSGRSSKRNQAPLAGIWSPPRGEPEEVASRCRRSHRIPVPELDPSSLRSSSLTERASVLAAGPSERSVVTSGSFSM
jgi:hypothetical protein